MKKLFSLILLTTSYSSLYPIATVDGKKERIFKDKNEEFIVCREIDNENEECHTLHVKQIQEIDKMAETNEKLASELIKKILIAQTRFAYLSFKAKSELKTRLKSEHNADQEISRENLEQLYPLTEASLMPRSLSRFMDNPNDSEIRSMLPEKEQKMFDELRTAQKEEKMFDALRTADRK